MTMTSPLTIRNESVWNITHHTITGFTDEDWQKIQELPDGKIIDWLMDELDERNGGIGTCWVCGYGIKEVRIRQGENIVVTTNISCD